jgi:hypothetical protein
MKLIRYLSPYFFCKNRPTCNDSGFLRAILLKISLEKSFFKKKKKLTKKIGGVVITLDVEYLRGLIAAVHSILQH